MPHQPSLSTPEFRPSAPSPPPATPATSNSSESPARNGGGSRRILIPTLLLTLQAQDGKPLPPRRPPRQTRRKIRPHADLARSGPIKKIVKPHIQSRLAQIRKSRGVGASDLARRVNVSRQTIYAIEAGTYVPNTEVALLLARELEVSIDELFSLEENSQPGPDAITADVLSAEPPAKGQPVRICQIGSRWISVPVSASPYYMPEADGIVSKSHNHRADLVVFAKDEASQKRLVLAGCDPATGLLSRMVEKISGIEVVSAAASSKLALTWLKDGKVHIAGSHLEDSKTGEFNLPFIRKEFP